MKGAGFRKISVFLAAQILCSAGLFISSLFAGEAGTAGASFLKFAPSPRGTAMGEAYTAVTEDAYAAYWNPAGLAAVEQAEIALTYNASFEDVTHQYLSAAFPLRYGSTLDMNVTRLTVAPFQGYDAVGRATSKVQSSDMAIGVGYGQTLLKDEIERPLLNVGVNVKSISQTLNNVSANAFAADLGAVYYLRPARYWLTQVQAQEYRFALTVRNIGTGLKFDKVEHPLPTSVTLGSSWLSHPYGNSTLVLSMDHSIANDETYSLGLGAEYVAFQLISFRAGYKSGQDIGSGIRFGVGFKLSFADVDYSMSPFGELGAMHKVGMSVKFGKSYARTPLTGASQRVEKAKMFTTKDKIEKLEIFANDFVGMAKRDLEERAYVSAEGNLNKAFNLEPKLRNGEWGDRGGRLASINKELRLKDSPAVKAVLMRDDEQSNTANEAIMAYINGSDLKAFLLAHAALGADIHGEPVFEELLLSLGRLTRNSVRRDEVLSRTALVKEKLRKAAKYFYVQQFSLAAKECHEAVLLDETNAVAWTRLGSAYFMMGDREKAKHAYMEALKLNPGDILTKKFLDAQGWK
ncbi:MAG: PorV/PorQ family protein [Elusimicrobiales bacterium]|nr:PorV/PorQ family protein [Elusimicrobiales bacterium]